MATINVRQMDDDVVRRLKERAGLNNRSLEGEVRHILEGAVADDMWAKRTSFLALATRLRRGTEGRTQTPGGSLDPRRPRQRASGHPMRLVVDASVAVKWLIAEEGSDAAHRLAAGADDLHAPRLMASEIANALWRKARMGEIERPLAGALAAAVPEMPVRWSADEEVCADAARLALSLDRPVYDCVYLALAHRLGAWMVTADQRFANALSSTEHGDMVLTLADHVRTQG